MSLFQPSSPSGFLARARKRMTVGKLDEAARVVAQGLAQFPDSGSLSELALGIRRAQAHKTMRRLEARIQKTRDPLAFEELIQLYRQLSLPQEALRRAEAYAAAHPGRDTPHLILGEMNLALFLEELNARHGHAAHEHLLHAANLNAMALQPRMLLAELYFCAGAGRAIAPLLKSLRQMAPETTEMRATFAVLESVANPHAETHLDGMFERIEVEGELARDPEDWPLSQRRSQAGRIDEGRVDATLQQLVADEVFDEVVLLRRDGTLVTHASPTGLHGASAEVPEASGTLLQPGVARAPSQHFVDVVRTVGRKVFPRARDLDMGKFKQCTLRGAFGTVVVGRVCNVLVGIRGQQSSDPLKQWTQIQLELENLAGGVS